MNLVTASSMLNAALICLPLTTQAEEVIINAAGDVMRSIRLKSHIQGRDGRYVAAF